MPDRSVSVVLPVYNEEGNIYDVVKAIFDFLPSVTNDFEVIAVDDGSFDRTAEVLEDLKTVNNYLKAIRHPKNKGYGAALVSGFKLAEKELILMMDADRQFDISEISKFIPHIEEFDIVAGFRLKRKDSLYRRALAYLGRFCVTALFNIKMQDIKCGFKLFKAEILKKLTFTTATKGGTINIEIIAFAKKNNLKIKEIGVNHYPRLYGKQTGGSLKTILRAVWEALRLKWKFMSDTKFFMFDT